MALATRGLHSFLAESASSNVSTNVATRGSATFGQKPFVGHSGRGGTAAFPSAQPRNRFNAALVSASAVLERPAAQQRLHVEPAFEVGLATCCILVSPHAQQEHPACRSGSSLWTSRAISSLARPVTNETSVSKCEEVIACLKLPKFAAVHNTSCQASSLSRLYVCGVRQVLGYAPEAPGPLPPVLYRLLDPNLSVDLPPAHKVLRLCRAKHKRGSLALYGCAGTLSALRAHICYTCACLSWWKPTAVGLCCALFPPVVGGGRNCLVATCTCFGIACIPVSVPLACTKLVPPRPEASGAGRL